MPTVTFSKRAVESMLGKKLSLEQLKDRISMIGTDLERIEGDEIVVEIFPNRPDMLSQAGFARALSSFVGARTGLVKYKASKDPKYKVLIDKSVKTVRPFTACAVVKGLKFDDENLKEVIQLQEKLHTTFGRDRKKLAIGIYPLEAIAMPIKYTALEPSKIKFQPLDAATEMTGEQILSEHPTGRAYAHLLLSHSKYPVFVDAKGEVLSMPPIINSEKTGRVTSDTRDVFVECSGFDFNVLNECLNIIVTSLADMDGEIFEMKLEYEKPVVTPRLEPEELDLDTEYIRKMVGLDLSDKQIKELLEKMGYGVSSGKVLVPCYRTDILHQIDIAEDVAIAYGYENFEPQIPSVSTLGEEDRFEVFKSRLCNVLVGLGFVETINYHLTDPDMEKKALAGSKLVELANSLTAGRSVLRSELLPQIMQVFADNSSKEYPQMIFEQGVVFSHGKSETGVVESDKLCVAICDAAADFTKIRQVLDCISDAVGLSVRYEKVSLSQFIDGRCARVICDEKIIGYVGEISPEVLRNFGLLVPVCIFEIELRGDLV